MSKHKNPKTYMGWDGAEHELPSQTATAAVTSDQAQIQMIAVGELRATPDNPRKFREDEAFASLCASIAKIGILQPLIARPLKGMSAKAAVKYDLRAGERRWRAAKKVGLAEVPVIVRDLDDREAMEITVTENLQREDLTPLEESDGVQHLLDVGWSIEEVADRFGKSAKWVARRARLRELSGGWRSAIANPKHWASDYSAGLLEIVARLPADIQEDLFEDLDQEGGRVDYEAGLPTVEALDRYVAKQYLRTLRAARWKLDDDTLVPEAGACTACPKRSSCQPLLFDDPDEDSKSKTAKDRCLDAACYQRKAEAFAALKVQTLTAEGTPPVRVIGDGTDWDELNRLAKGGALRQYEITTCKKSDKGAVPAVIVSGANAGETTWVAGAKSAGSSARVQRAAAGGKKSLKEKQAGLEKRRQVWVVNTIREQIDLAVDGKKSIVPTGKAYTKDSMPWNARLLLAFGTAWNADVHWHDSDGSRGAVRGDDQPCGWPALELFSKANDEEISREMGRHVLRVFSDRLAGVGAAPDANDYYADAKRMCELLGVDFHELRLQAEDAIPTPKAWVAEMAAAKDAKAKGSRAKSQGGKKRGKGKDEGATPALKPAPAR